MPHVKLKNHLLDIRQQALFGRVHTRCGKFKKGQKGLEGTRSHAIRWVTDWDDQVDYLPVEGRDYCLHCIRSHKSDDGYQEHEVYGDKINGV